MTENDQTQEWEEIKTPVWKPTENGDTISGVLLQKNPDVGSNKSMVYIVETAPGHKMMVWGSAVLDSRLQEATAGDIIKLVYRGVKGKVKQFDVFRKKA